MWDLVPWPGIEPQPPALGAGSLSNWTARESPVGRTRKEGNVIALNVADELRGKRTKGPSQKFQVPGRGHLRVLSTLGLTLYAACSFKRGETAGEHRHFHCDEHELADLYHPAGKNAGVGSHFLLQGIFLTQGSNLGFLHCRWILYH